MIPQTRLLSADGRHNLKDNVNDASSALPSRGPGENPPTKHQCAIQQKVELKFKSASVHAFTIRMFEQLLLSGRRLDFRTAQHKTWETMCCLGMTLGLVPMTTARLFVFVTGFCPVVQRCFVPNEVLNSGTRIEKVILLRRKSFGIRPHETEVTNQDLFTQNTELHFEPELFQRR
ncbi:hypothetical protein F2P81_017622 [Scophthalmus maximus]|uniref:Uncharacterized protein n=1 Tax=Scophthalmus maximus TaxID=52904 RepID=A0A6A4SID0_SCOMX|nr:hypothetical protein F2P81_017622 [Scophthalmus maximus]